MCPASAERISVLLLNRGHGDQGAWEKLIPLVYAELRRIAHRYLWQERPNHTLQSRAAVLGISLATVKRNWATARAWLQREMKQKEARK